MSQKNDPHAFSDAWKEGVYAAIFKRRDMRKFKPDPISATILARLFKAAHHAPSVGFMQPWNFMAITDSKLKQDIATHVEQERIKAADGFDEDRKEKYLTYKLEGIVESPVNVCITCDRSRVGPAVIGRNTIRETDLYSTCCAVQNFWLAARAEGIGVGWVSILKPELLQELLAIPKEIVPVAYLCVGYVEEFGAIPELEAADWLPRVPLEDLVYGNQWGASPPVDLSKAIKEG